MLAMGGGALGGKTGRVGAGWYGEGGPYKRVVGGAGLGPAAQAMQPKQDFPRRKVL